MGFPMIMTKGCRKSHPEKTNPKPKPCTVPLKTPVNVSDTLNTVLDANIFSVLMSLASLQILKTLHW